MKIRRKKTMLVFNELIKTQIYYRILFAHKMKMNWQTLDMVVGIAQEGSSIASDKTCSTNIICAPVNNTIPHTRIRRM